MFIEKLVFNKTPEEMLAILQQIDTAGGYPKKGFVNGVERTDEKGTTDHLVLYFPHPNIENRWRMDNEQGIPQEIIDSADDTISSEEAYATGGWVREIV